MTQPLYHVDFSVLLGLRWWFVLRLSKWNQIFPHKPHTVVNSGLNLQYSRAVTFQEWLLFILHNKLGILKYAEKHSVPVQLSELLQQHISTNLDQSLLYEPSVLFLTQRELFIFSLFIVFFFFLCPLLLLGFIWHGFDLGLDFYSRFESSTQLTFF